MLCVLGPLNTLTDVGFPNQESAVPAQAGRVSEWLSNLSTTDSGVVQAFAGEHNSVSDNGSDASCNETDYSAYRSRRSPSSG